MLYALAQLAGAVAFLAGLYLQLGLEPTLIIGGALLFAGALAVEVVARRASAPARTAPDRLRFPAPPED